MIPHSLESSAAGDAQAGAGPMSKIICIRTFNSRLEAEIARGALEANGIKAMVSADDGGGIRPELAFSMGVRLLVNEEHTEDARKMLDEVAE